MRNNVHLSSKKLTRQKRLLDLVVSEIYTSKSKERFQDLFLLLNSLKCNTESINKEPGTFLETLRLLQKKILHFI